jgi:hypothetical protein
VGSRGTVQAGARVARCGFLESFPASNFCLISLRRASNCGRLQSCVSFCYSYVLQTYCDCAIGSWRLLVVVSWRPSGLCRVFGRLSLSLLHSTPETAAITHHHTFQQLRPVQRVQFSSALSAQASFCSQFTATLTEHSPSRLVYHDNNGRHHLLRGAEDRGQHEPQARE